VLSRRLTFSLLVLLLVLLAGETVFLYWEEHHPKENPYDPIIVAVAKDNGVDPFLIRALIWRESRFLPLTHGSADERGLMQVQPAVGEDWAKAKKIPNFNADDLYDPRINITVGTWHLARSMRLWSQANVDDPIPFALAEYNAGRKNALKWVDPANPQDHTAFMDRITFPSTRKYVEVILAKREEYRSRLATNHWYQDYAAANPTMTQTP